MGKWRWDRIGVRPYGNGDEMVLDHMRVGCWTIGRSVDGVKTHGDCVRIVYGCRVGVAAHGDGVGPHGLVVGMALGYMWIMWRLCRDTWE